MTNKLLFDVEAPPAPGQMTDSERRQAAEAKEGERRKAEGMALAAASKEHLLGRAREFAYDIARGVLPHADGVKSAVGLCNADDVYAAWERDGDRRERQGLARVPWIGNAAGSIFVGANWEAVGLVKSARPHAHANLLRQWKWRHNP